MSDNPATPEKPTTNTVIKLPPPSFVVIEPYNGQGESYREDSFSVLRMLLDAEKKPNEEQRWSAVKKWIADKLKVPETEITESQALLLHNRVINLTNKLKEEASKEVFTIASSQQPIQESQQNS